MTALTPHRLLLSKSSSALQQQRLRAVVVSSCSHDVLHHQCETIRINHPSSLHYHSSNLCGQYYSSTIHEGYAVQPPLNNDNNNLSLLQWQQQRHLYTHYEKLTNNNNNHRCKFFSTLPNSNDSDSSDSDSDSDNHESSTNNNNDIINHPQHNRLSTLRNVGIFAHVDAGKTTVTERMLALSGIVHDPGSVDNGDTVTDYLPAERERGITIQSAAVKFDWIVPPPPPPPVLKAGSTFSKSTRERSSAEQPTAKKVSINLIDTPGHVDFSVEVHRSVAVLDGALLVVDAVAGVQAQTETVWRAIRNTDGSSTSSSLSTLSTTNNDSNEINKKKSTVMHGSHAHEPLPTLMYINKMDRIGSDYNHAISTVIQKLGGSNPLVVQLPLYQIIEGSSGSDSSSDDNNNAVNNIVVGTLEDAQPPNGNFVGVLDIVNMRTIVYPNNIEELSMEEAVPIVTSLLSASNDTCTHSSKKLMEVAVNARRELISNLANVDEIMEDLYLLATLEQDDDGGGGSGEENIEDYITTDEIQASIRRMTLQRKVMPTLCGAALRGVGVEPLLDCVAEYCKFFASYVCVSMEMYDFASV